MRAVPSHLGPLLLVAAAVGLGWVLLDGELRIAPPEINDRVVHVALVDYAARHWSEHWPPNHWFPTVTAGFPVFAHYPHLSHLVGAALARLLPAAEPGRVYLTLNFLVLSLIPAVIYASMRRLESGAWESAIAAALYPLVFSNPHLGIGWESFVHDGSGLLPQVWGVGFIFPALAWGHDAIRGRAAPRSRPRRVLAAGLLLAACALSHSVYGYMAGLSVALLPFFPEASSRWLGRVGRLAAVGGVALLASAYFVVPFAVHADQVLVSQWEPAWKYDSIGLRAALLNLAGGRMFDGGGPPFLTLVLSAGVVVSLVRAVRAGDACRLWLLACLVLWLLLFGGRATWGRLVDWLPFAGGLPMHRFSGGVQVFFVMLAAGGIDPAAAGRRRRAAVWVAALTVGVCLLPPLARRVEFMARNDERAAQRRAALDADQDFRTVVDDLRRLPPGRVHAGMHHNWGKPFAIGGIPVYTHLQSSGFDMVGFPFMGMAPPAEWQLRTDFGRFPYCDLYNARYIVAPRTLPAPTFGKPIASRGDLVVYEVATSGYFGLGAVEALDLSRVPTGSLQSAPWAEVYRVGKAWLDGPGPAEHRYLAMQDTAPEPLPDGPVGGEIRGESVGPGRFACEVAVPRPADLVLKVTFHPYWQCRVNGAPTPVARVFPGFMAVRLPSGNSAVEFVYRPPSYQKWLFALSGLMLAGGIAAAFPWRRGSGRITA